MGQTPCPGFFCAPDGGVDILIPYPEGIDKDNYDFIIGHLITSNVNGAASGTMEFFEPEKTADGLKIHITSASPFIIGWKQAAGRGLTAPAQSANTGYITGGIVPILIVLAVLSVAVAAFAVFNREGSCQRAVNSDIPGLDSDSCPSLKKHRFSDKIASEYLCFFL